MKSFKKQIWNKFCEKNNVIKQSVPLFATDKNLKVSIKEIGKTAKRSVLTRSVAMENFLLHEVEKVQNDHRNGGGIFDGIIYIMFWEENGSVIPLYVGKAEKYGKNNGNLSANLIGLKGDKGKFCRWGDNYAYHIGDLSAVTLPGHPEKKQNPKYHKWSQKIFIESPSAEPRLGKEVMFWAKAWGNAEIGIWEEFGPTRLTFLEYLLIGVASSIFEDDLLNEEGKNRGAS